MSRKKPPFNLPQQESNHSAEFDESSPSSEETTRWRQLLAKLLLNSHPSTSQVVEDTEAETVPQAEIAKSSYLKILSKFLAQLPWRKKPSFDPQKVQREILADIGRQLYQARWERRLTLEAIATETCISPGLLQAIEKGNLADLPEPIYTRGLIKKFANYLGLDGTALAERFPTDIALKSSRSPQFRIWLPSIQLRPLHLYFLYIAIVILSVQSISNTLKRAALEGAIKETPVPTPSYSSPSPPQPLANPNPLKKPIMVKVQLQGDCQLKVVVDGKTDFEGMLPRETQRTWVAEQQLAIKADNAGQVIVAFNNQPKQRLGKLGETKEVTYPSKLNPKQKSQ